VPLLNAVDKVPLLNRVKVIKRIARLIDLALDSKTEAMIRAMNRAPGRRGALAEAEPGRLHLNDPRDIPAAIRAGRSIDSWQLTPTGKFA